MIKLNGVKFDYNKYPAGEFKLDTPLDIFATHMNILWKFESCEEIVLIQMLGRHFKELYKDEVILIMPYVAFARMDRVKDCSEVFTLKYFCEMINSIGFKNVYIAEPHSDVCIALLNNVVISYSVDESVDKILEEIDFDDNKDILFFPDAGAQKRYSSIKIPSLVGHKHRDWKTGEIKGLEVCGEVPKEPFKALILDDLSSYGGTFLHSARKLRELGAYEVYLLVGHCENSILQGEMINSGLIDMVYTTDSIFIGNHPKIKIIKEIK